jgi:hypothetical protein
MVTVTPHLKHAVGVLMLSDSESRGIFKPVLEAETAVPARRTVVFSTPKDGGDVLVKICEGIRDIKVTQPTKTAKVKDAGSDSDDDDESDEEDEVREKVWKIGKVIAEAAIKGVKKGGKVEVMINVSGDMGVTITAREVGTKGGVRGSLEKVVANGSA